MPLLCSLVGLLAARCSGGQNVVLGALPSSMVWIQPSASLKARNDPERAFHALTGLLMTPHMSWPLSEAGIDSPTWMVHDPVLLMHDSISQEQLLLPFVAHY